MGGLETKGRSGVEFVFSPTSFFTACTENVATNVKQTIKNKFGDADFAFNRRAFILSL